jgi:hypothetical protein
MNHYICLESVYIDPFLNHLRNNFYLFNLWIYKYLVVLTAQDYIQAKAAYDTPAICTFSMEEDMKVSYFTPESFEGSVNI